MDNLAQVEEPSRVQRLQQCSRRIVVPPQMAALPPVPPDPVKRAGDERAGAAGGAGIEVARGRREGFHLYRFSYGLHLLFA